MKELMQQFSIIKDPRHSRYIIYKIENILTIVMCAALSGLDRLDDILVYQENNKKFLKDTFGIEKYPSKSTYSRVLSIIDSKAVGDVILQIMRERLGNTGEIIAVDGKAIRSAAKEGKPYAALQILSAYLTENGVTLEQTRIYEKTNEIPVFQQMLGYYLNVANGIARPARGLPPFTCRKNRRRFQLPRRLNCPKPDFNRLRRRTATQ